jgi:hypothetical protein
MANIPSKEELLSKLVWLFNYPVQSFTSVLDQIAKKKEEGDSAVVKEEPKVEDVRTEETKEEKTPTVEKVVEEPKAEEVAE